MLQTPIVSDVNHSIDIALAEWHGGTALVPGDTPCAKQCVAEGLTKLSQHFDGPPSDRVSHCTMCNLVIYKKTRCTSDCSRSSAYCSTICQAYACQYQPACTKLSPNPVMVNVKAGQAAVRSHNNTEGLIMVSVFSTALMNCEKVSHGLFSTPLTLYPWVPCRPLRMPAWRQLTPSPRHQKGHQPM